MAGGQGHMPCTWCTTFPLRQLAGCTWLQCKHKTEGVRGRAHPGKPDLCRSRGAVCRGVERLEVEPRCVALAVGWSKACAVRPCASERLTQ
eukprot:scaffold12271_cov66-Phaeocystis_antarctica.AAC.2